MGEEVQRQDPPPDEEMGEYWQRWPDDSLEADIRGVEVHSWTFPTSEQWTVTVSAGEYFRGGEPLGSELEQRIEGALSAVPGVTRLHRQDWPEWLVCGDASGEALCRAAVNVLDDMADRLRVAYDDDYFDFD